MARVRRTVVPKFIQINTQADYNKHIKPALGEGADAYGLEDIKGMWWELDDDTRLGAAKTMREIRDGIDKRPRIIFISGAGDERGITSMSLTEYAENMGLSVKDYLNGFTLESREVCGPLQESNTPKSYVLAHKGPNDTTYCKNKAGDWTTHIEDAWEGSGPDSFSAEMKRNFADAVHCGVEDLEVVPVEKFESVEFDTPHFKPRTYEGEYILYVLYGLDKDGDETDELAWSKNADVLKKKIAATLPDYKDAYAGFHAVAICYDKNGEMRDSAVVWSADQNESKGADETIEFEKGHKNSRGENAPWVIRDHKNGKVLASFAKKGDAEAHLERMKHYKKNENSVMDWANKIKDAVANAAKAAGLEDRITASATNMPKLFVDVYQIGTMGDGINWEITGNLGVRRFDRQSVKRHWRVDNIEELEKSLTDEFQQLKSGKLSGKTEAASRIVADNMFGKIAKARLRDNTLAFYPLDDDGKDDDCIYFFKLDGNDIVTKGYQWGRDGIDRGMIAEDGYPWAVEPGRPTRDYVHTKKYAKYLLDRVRKCLDLGIANGKTEAISDGDLLARLTAADPEKAKYIIRAFHDSEGYWVWFPDEVSTYEPYTHTLHEYTVAELLRAYKRSKIAGAKGESYERATKEIQVRKNGQPWTRYAVTWPEYVDTYTKEAKERGWDEVRVIDLGGKGKHEALFNAKALEDLAMNGIKSAVMAAWSGAGVKNFKLDIQRNDYNLDVYSKTLDGTPTGTSWRVLPIEGSVVRYTDNLTNGDTEVAADIPYITEDDVERIFTDEFKKLDDDMSEGYVSKEGNWGANNPDGFRKLDDLLEAAGFQCTFDNRFGDELVARDGEKFYVIEYNVPPDMVVDKNKPWEIFDGDSGEFMKNFADPKTAAAYLIAKKGKE